MEGEVTLKYSLLDFGCTLVGLVFFLVDIGLDVWAVVHFYSEGDFIYLALLVTFLVGSSVLGQLFSWLWYRYEDWETRTAAEGSVSKGVLQALHVLQLGVYLRYLSELYINYITSYSSWASTSGTSLNLLHQITKLKILSAR